MTTVQKLIIAGLVLTVICVFFALGVVVLGFGLSSEMGSTSTAVKLALGSICTKPRFGWDLSPDDVDVLLGEGDVVGELNPVSSIDVRFDCPKVSPEQISFQWYYNDQKHCTRTYISDDCDRSSLTDWDSLPGKFLVTLINKDGLIGDLPSGKYKLVVYVDGKEATSGTVAVNP